MNLYRLTDELFHVTYTSPNEHKLAASVCGVTKWTQQQRHMIVVLGRLYIKHNLKY
jgi:hypothetical protein